MPPGPAPTCGSTQRRTRGSRPGTKLQGERATLLDYLRACRLTTEMKCAGLDPAQLARRSVPPSAISLLGLIRHMADVERNWFRRVMAQANAPPRYWSGDLSDADWAGAVAHPAVVDDAWQAWRDEVAFAEKFVAGSPDLGIRGTMRDRDTIALREVLVHMIESRSTPATAATPTCCANGSTDASASDRGKPPRSLLPDHNRTIGAQHAMSHAYRFRHATAPPRSPSLSVVGAAHCLTHDIRRSARALARFRSRQRRCRSVSCM